MTYVLNPSVEKVSAPPISESAEWLKGNRSNLPAINLSQAVPSYPPAPELAAHTASCLIDNSANLYTDILGTPELRSELASNMSQAYAGTVRTEDVAITAGCNQAFCSVIQSIAGKGDNIILTSPWYFNHQMWLNMQGIEIRTITAMKDGTALPDPADLAAVCDDRTRALILISPNNPTGAIYPPSLIDRFFDTCKSHKIALVLDETYKDFLDAGSPPHNLFQRPDWRDTFIQLYSFSKVYALTGSRVGSAIAGPALIEAMEKVIDCIAICAPHSGQKAALFGLQHLEAWKQSKRELMNTRLVAMQTAFARHAPMYKIMSSGAFFAYLQHPFINHPAKDIAKALAQQSGVLTLPGTMFGRDQDRFLRLAFANVEADYMEDAAKRLAAFSPE